MMLQLAISTNEIDTTTQSNVKNNVLDNNNWFKLFIQIAKNLKGNNLYMFGSLFAVPFGICVITSALAGVLTSEAILAVIIIFIVCVLSTYIVVGLDVISKRK